MGRSMFSVMQSMLIVISMPVTTTMVMPSPVASTMIPMAVISAMLTMPVSMFPVSPVVPVAVVKSTYCVDHGVGDSCTDQDLRRPIAAMISACAERNHQADRNTGGCQPQWNRATYWSACVGIHDVVSLSNYATIMRART